MSDEVSKHRVIKNGSSEHKKSFQEGDMPEHTVSVTVFSDGDMTGTSQTYFASNFLTDDKMVTTEEEAREFLDKHLHALMGSGFTIEITNGEDAYSLYYSVEDFCNTVLNGRK